MADRALRVLHLIETLGRGGAEQLLVTLLPALKSHGIEPIVGVLREPFTLETDLERAGIETIHFPSVHRWNLPAASGALRKLCRDRRVELVHAHLYFPSLYAGLLGRLSGIPTAETFHNMAYAGANRASWKLTARRRLRSAILRRSGGTFFGVSQAVADHYQEALGLERIDVLPNAIDLGAIGQVVEARQARGTQEERTALTIAVPGRLVHEKGHSDLLEALTSTSTSAQTNDAAPDPGKVQLVFIGGGPLEAALRQKAAKLQVPLRITGTLPHAAMLREMDAADLVVIPSRYEGFGLTAAEAMALGKPLIASDAGGLPEVVGDTARLFRSGHSDDLASAIAAHHADPAHSADLAERAQARATREFSAAGIAAKLAQAYRRALEG